MKNTLLTCIIMWMCLSGLSQTFYPLTSGVSTLLYAMHFTDEDHGICVGIEGVILKTTDGGANWNLISSGVSTDLRDVVFFDTNVGYACGFNGVILKTIDGGSSWDALTSNTNLILNNILVVDNDIYASGEEGMILKSSDAGLSWSALNSGTLNKLYGIFFTTSSTGYIVGWLGTIVKTVDAGANWEIIDGGNTSHLTSIYFTNENNGYIVGGSIGDNSSIIMRTTDAGENWSISPTIDNNWLIDVRFINSNIGYITGGDIVQNTSTIMKTVDGGENWDALSSHPGRQVSTFFPTADVGYTCGLDGTIFKTTELSSEVVSPQAAEANLTLFPNPNNGRFRVISDSEFFTKPFRMEIFDSSGKMIFETFHTKEIDLSLCGKGIYSIKLNTEKGVFIRKVLVQ